jgi:hypothetical protein
MWDLGHILLDHHIQDLQDRRYFAEEAHNPNSRDLGRDLGVVLDSLVEVALLLAYFWVLRLMVVHNLQVVALVSDPPSKDAHSRLW